MYGDLSFLWFKPTKQIAWTQMLSSAMTKLYRGQLHFLPQDPKPYVQITQSGSSITIDDENYNVYLLDCNDEAFEINDHVDINTYIDEFGVSQLYIRLKYLPLDYGMNLVCLRINSTVGETAFTWYSNPFLLTGLFSNQTTRIDYIYTGVYSEVNTYCSARLRMFRNDYVSGTELNTYYQVTKGQTVISRVNKKRYSQWTCEKMDSWHWIRLEEALYNSPCYFNYIRNYPAEALDFEARLGDTNMNQQFLITDPNERDVINIVDIIIIPDITYVPMLASTDVLASTDQIASEIETPVP